MHEFEAAFIDAERGWVRAVPAGFKTEDGGVSWPKVEFGNAVNKTCAQRDGDQFHLRAVEVSVASMSMLAAAKD